MSAAPRTNRTEFARWVDANPTRIPEWNEWRIAYFKKFHHRDPQFGQYIRSIHKLEFVRVYEEFWLNSPELWSGECQNMDSVAHAIAASRAF